MAAVVAAAAVVVAAAVAVTQLEVHCAFPDALEVVPPTAPHAIVPVPAIGDVEAKAVEAVPEPATQISDGLNPREFPALVAQPSNIVALRP